MDRLTPYRPASSRCVTPRAAAARIRRAFLRSSLAFVGGRWPRAHSLVRWTKPTQVWISHTISASIGVAP